MSVPPARSVPHRPRSRSLRWAAVGSALAAAAGLLVMGAGGAQAAPAYSTTPLHFAVTAGGRSCDVVGDLYLPSTASAAHRVPAILTTNGFGGSAADQTPFAEREATLGYAVLSYSGLGFGGSACPITLDDPDVDGVAARQLVSYLGGAPGIAFTDAAHTQPAPVLTSIVHDARDHDGVAQKYDPRVGMWGGSYGGEIQFAAAAVDPRIDMLVPQITWNDLSYSLAPNNATAPGSVSPATPGAVKITWGLLFSSVGILDGVKYAQQDPYRLVGCPNFATFVCSALVTGGTLGYFQPADVAALRHASVSSYLSRIRVPVLLDQGQVDTLFNLNEAVATYRSLRAQGTPVAMMWRESGHSGGTATAAGDAYETARIQAWFDHYLQGTGADLGPAFAYYRDWTGTFASAPSYPVGAQRTYYLSGDGTLASSAAAVTPGSQTLLTSVGGLPTSLSSPDAIGSQLPSGVSLDVPDTNLPGTYATWQTGPLTASTDVVGAPQLTTTISAPSAALTSALGPAGQLVLVAKLYDVAPDGSAALIHGLVAPFRVTDPTRPVQVTLPAVAHRFAAGHRIRVVLAGGDVNYRTGLLPAAVTVSGSTAQRLTLPVVG